MPIEPLWHSKTQKRLAVRRFYDKFDWLRMILCIIIGWLRKHWERIVIVFIGVLIVASVAAFFGVMFYESVAFDFQKLFGIKESKNPKKEVLEFLGFGISGVIALYGLVALNRRASAQVRQNEITETGHFQERFKAAVEHLSNEKESGRIASFYEFFYLAKDRKEDYAQSILDILCAHLRQITDYNDIPDDKIKYSEEVNTLIGILFGRETGKIFDGLKFDLQRVNLTAFDFSMRMPTGKIDFRSANLRKAILYGADLQGADLRGANLRRANLWMANLQGAMLHEANLQGAKLDKVNLREAMLHEANLQGAKLWEADLQGADLQLAYLQEANVQRVNLQKAKLHKTDLWGANLWGANLQEADLWGANLRNANLRNANLQETKKLETANLSGAKYNDETKFPDGFEPQSNEMQYISPDEDEK